MTLLEWIVPLLLGAVALTAMAGRLGVPYPAFLAVGGVALALLPHGPQLTLDPDLALALFVAPCCSIPPTMPRCATCARPGPRSPCWCSSASA